MRARWAQACFYLNAPDASLIARCVAAMAMEGRKWRHGGEMHRPSSRHPRDREDRPDPRTRGGLAHQNDFVQI